MNLQIIRELMQTKQLEEIKIDPAQQAAAARKTQTKGLGKDLTISRKAIIPILESNSKYHKKLIEP